MKSEKELKANRLAQDLLIPPDNYQAFLDADLFNKLEIQRFAKELGIAPGIVVGRLQHDKVTPFSTANTLKKRFEFREETKQKQGE